MKKKYKTLRPWVWNVIAAIEGITIAILIIIAFCYTFEALTGFNPLWLGGFGC